MRRNRTSIVAARRRCGAVARSCAVGAGRWLPAMLHRRAAQARPPPQASRLSTRRRSSSASRNSKPPARSRRAPPSCSDKLKAEIDAIGAGSHASSTSADRHRRPGARRRDPDRRHRGAAAPARQPASSDPRLARQRRGDDRRGAGGAAAIGRRPPPALLVRPGGRAGIGAHRHAARRRRAGDARPRPRRSPPTSASWCAVRKAIAGERDRLAARSRQPARTTDQAGRAGRRAAAKQSAVEQDIEAEARARAWRCRGRSTALKDLIAKMEQDLKSAAEAAAAAARPPKGAPGQRHSRIWRALKDPGRLSPAIAFASAKGLLPLPVNGSQIRGFRRLRRRRRHRKGHFARRPGPAPRSGPVRRLGGLCRTVPLLRTTLDPQRRRRVSCLFAGMDGFRSTSASSSWRASRSRSWASVAGRSILGGSNTSQPVLYVEFRKDGTSIDPAHGGPQTNEKVRG